MDRTIGAVIRFQGIVQGVGFRPAVHRLATAIGLAGGVWNDPDGATIEVEGDADPVAEFVRSLPDSLPVISRSPRYENVFFAFGHGHIGLTAAAVTGRAVAASIGGERSPFDLSPFRADRF